MRPRRMRLAAVSFVLLALLATSHASSAATTSDTTACAADHYKALHGQVSLKLTKSKDGGKPTVELAVAVICKRAGVPYQVKRSRTLTNKACKARIEPLALTDVVAGRAIVALTANAGLVMKIDDQGVYLEPKADELANLTPVERFQRGTAIHLDVETLRSKDTDGHYHKTTVQRVQVQLTVTSTQPFTDVKLVVHLYAHIQKDTRLRELDEDDDRPRFGQNEDFVRIHEETLEIGELPRSQAKIVKTKRVRTSYEKHRYYYRRDRKYGEKYYGSVVDVYIGDTLIKSVASTRKLFELLERDSRTGFPE